MKDKQKTSIRRAAALVGVLAIVVGFAVSPSADEGGAGQIEFTDVRQQTKDFHRYFREIELTAEQEAVMREALEDLAAPCCQDKSAYTCCCECNMGRSWWGLSKFLIAEKGAGAEEVREAVSRWFDFIHPRGSSGTACYTGGCARSFKDDGCGGMREDQVVF